MIRPYDLTRWRGMASRAHRHELAEPVRVLCDELELALLQNSTLVADLHRLRLDLQRLSLANHAYSVGSDRTDEQIS